jgi:hypothetical protein
VEIFYCRPSIQLVDLSACNNIEKNVGGVQKEENKLLHTRRRLGGRRISI